MSSKKLDITLDEILPISATEAQRRKRIYRGNLADLIDREVDKTLRSVEETGAFQDTSRQAYYALKAEYRNFKYLQNLLLSRKTLQQNRLRAELSPLLRESILADDLDRALLNELETSESIIGSLVHILRPANKTKLKSGALSVLIQ